MVAWLDTCGANDECKFASRSAEFWKRLPQCKESARGYQTASAAIKDEKNFIYTIELIEDTIEIKSLFFR